MSPLTITAPGDHAVKRYLSKFIVYKLFNENLAIELGKEPVATAGPTISYLGRFKLLVFLLLSIYSLRQTWARC